ncbi:MAG TPA: nucleoside hydrolase, partial [Erysipelotrichaceae bacterium]|nr:nucleoside hydrolase [Erysipelotrichaceae bacterium]
MDKKRKVIIDCDPGVDDALAINALLLKEDIEVLGISCVGGNRPLEYTYKNALRLVDFFKKDVRVYKGVAPLSIDPSIKSSFFHGKNGFGDVEIPYTTTNLSDINAIDFMEEMLLKYP